MVTKPPIAFPDAARKQAIASLSADVAADVDDPIGDLKAGLLFDFIPSKVAPRICSRAIADARAFFEVRSNDLVAVCYRDELPASRGKT